MEIHSSFQSEQFYVVGGLLGETATMTLWKYYVELSA